MQTRARLLLKKILYTLCHLISFTIHPFVLALAKLKYFRRLRILVYHRMCDLPEESGKEYFNVRPEAFSAQLNALKVEGYRIFTVDEVLDYLTQQKPFPPRSVCITFDDGYRNNYLNAFPLLKLYKFKATFFLATAYIGSNSRFPWLSADPKLSYAESIDNNISIPMSWSESKEMALAGMEFGNHSSNHLNFSTLSLGEIENEIYMAASTLSDQLQEASKVFVCPFGLNSNKAAQVVPIIKSLGYRGSIWGRMGAVNIYSNPHDLPRISIYSTDTLSVFKRKVHGAYDWMGQFQPIWSYLNSLFTSRGGQYE